MQECSSGARGAEGMSSCGFKEAYDRQRVRMRSGNEPPAFPDISAAVGARQGAVEGRDGGIDFAFRDFGGGNELQEIISGGRSGNSAGNHGLGGGRGNFFGGDGAGGVGGTTSRSALDNCHLLSATAASFVRSNRIDFNIPVCSLIETSTDSIRFARSLISAITISCFALPVS